MRRSRKELLFNYKIFCPRAPFPGARKKSPALWAGDFAFFIFSLLKEALGFAVRAPGAHFDDVFAFRVGASYVEAVLPAVGIGLFEGAVNVDDIVAVVVFISAVLNHIVFFSVIVNLSTHFSASDYFLILGYYKSGTKAIEFFHSVNFVLSLLKLKKSAV